MYYGEYFVLCVLWARVGWPPLKTPCNAQLKGLCAASICIAVEMDTEFLNAAHVRPCFFSYHRIRLSFSVVFLGWRVRMFVIRTAENPKIGNIGVEIHVSIYKKLWSPYFLKNITKSLNYRRCDI